MRATLFPCLLANFLKEIFISSVKSHKYLNKLIKYKNNGRNFLKNTMYKRTIPLIKS